MAIISTCQNCGRQYDDYKGVGGGFCSNRCRDEYFSREETKRNKSKNDYQEQQLAKAARQQANAAKEESKARASVAKMEANAIKEEMRAQKELAEAEANKIKLETELIEKDHRNRRADELRSQGRNFQANVVQYRLDVVAGAVIGLLAFAIVIMVFMKNQDNDKKADYELHVELERKEVEILKAIQNGEHEKALSIIEQLNHPSNSDSKKGNGWNHISYSEYWSKRKDQLRNEIIGDPNKSVINENDTDNKSKLSNEHQVTTPEQEVTVADNNEIDKVSNVVESNETSTNTKVYGTIISEKAFFYTSADMETKKKSYLIHNQNVEILEEKEDFFRVIYTNDKGGLVYGWILKTDIRR